MLAGYYFPTSNLSNVIRSLFLNRAGFRWGDQSDVGTITNIHLALLAKFQL